MSHSAIVFPAGFVAFDPLPEGQDHWFTLEELVQFTHYSQPAYNWDRLVRQWPWRWQDGERRFSAYAVWKKYTEQGLDYKMPADFRAYFAACHAAQQARLQTAELA